VATTTSSVPKATVEDFSSVVAEHHADWDGQVATTEANCLDPLTTIACSLGYQTLGLKAQTIWLALTAVHKPSSLVYKGVPPDRVADLLSETESAADAAGLAADALVAADCPDPMATDCIAEYLAVSRAVNELSRKLDAWSVY
jgi:hypothetical protein